ncbi:PAS domain S-box protein [Candidatus Daviesbacteria bacterium]|nr:PAS domain S-box protein [Candidatus Daviesbacteria bacterium]
MRLSLLVKIASVITVGILTAIFLSLFLSQNVIFSATAGILVICFTNTIISLLLKPLKKLVDSFESLGRGNFNARADVRSGDEFEVIAKHFNDMTASVSKVYQNLETEKDIAVSQVSKINDVLSSIIDGVIALDFNKNILISNKAAEEITGYTQQELQGQNIDKLIHLFDGQEEIVSKTYCQTSFNKSVKLIGKGGKQASVNLLSSKSNQTVQSNISCVLILHDLSKEEELERMKFDFVSMASHELKTPLTSIIGYLSVFVSENKGKVAKEELELVERSLASSQQLLSLVQNLLNVNKIERDQMSVMIETVDYSSILSKTAEELKNQASLKNIMLSLNIASH